MVPTLEEIEEYLESVEELLQSSLATATTDLPSLKDAVNRLWADVARFGPSIPSMREMHIPGLGEFEVPLAPPDVPVESSLSQKSLDWIAGHRWTAAGIAVGTVGAGLMVGYKVKRSIYNQKLKTSNNFASSERRKVVVVLGGDVDPLGLPLILALEKCGFIVVTSVSTPDAVEVLESQCQGYVRALVLDPSDPATVPIFVRSLSSTLSRRFPLGSPGDLHTSSTSHAHVHSLISLLTLPNTSLHAPLERISLRTEYLQYLTRTHITPLTAIQSILPMLRSNSARARDSVSNNAGHRSIVVCLPAADTRVGLLFSSTQAMSAAATLRGIEVLRREINVAALTDKTESMKHIKVIAVDVGTFATGQAALNGMQAMEGWTTSEKLAYGPAFASISHDIAPASSWKNIFREGYQYGVPRRPSGVSTFVDAIINVVDGGRRNSISFFGYRIGLGKLANLLRGDRFCVGAGATTYKLASLLPTLALDVLLNLPHLLVSIRNSLLPVQPFIAPPTIQPTMLPSNLTFDQEELAKPDSSIGSSSVGSNSVMHSEAGSEADIESNSGEGTSVDSSWVQLKD